MRTILLAMLTVLSCKQHDERHVLFVCEHGAAKSVIAAAYFNRMAADRGIPIRAIARGAEPQAIPSKATEAGLRADGVSSPGDAPAPLTAADIRDATDIIDFDCDHPAMRPVSALGSCWDDVPAIADGYDRARDRIRAHVAAYFEALQPVNDRLR
jgi:protein-tyrosine-phosphatase